LPAFECVGSRADGQILEVLVAISPVREVDGRMTGVSLVARDIGARKAAERKAALLLGELDHRVKNILAIVSSVVSQTLKTTTTPDAFAVEVNGRIQAIAKAHSLLTQSGQGEVLLRAILETELAPYDSGNVVIEGPDVALTPRAGLALAMALHELVGNAVKYGALSSKSGNLAIGWSVSGPVGNEAMSLVWTETGGPVVSEPTRRGFGTTLIERTLAHELDADVTRVFAAAGLHCDIVLPFNDEIGRLVPANVDGGGS
ncbi:MAG: sensor histidine kinase, partial [Janthinobacterium lividum]